MLDNAIRGAKEAENDKSIGIKIKEENGRIYISVSNYLRQNRRKSSAANGV